MSFCKCQLKVWGRRKSCDQVTTINKVIVALDPRHKTHNIPGKFLSYMQGGLPVLASINPGNDLAEMIEREGVGRGCTDQSAETLQRLALELVDEIASGKSVSARCRALSSKLFSPEAAVKQVTEALAR